MQSLITTEDVADWLRVDVVTVRRLVGKGDITAYRVGSEYRFKREDLDDYLIRQRVAPKGKERGLRSIASLLHRPVAAADESGPSEHFTRRAHVVIDYAEEEARRLHHNYMGTEHLLLGIAREGKGIGAQVLVKCGIELSTVRTAVEKIVGRRDDAVEGAIGLTPRAKKVMELAVSAARELDHSYVGTEHLLLGLVREGEGIAAGILESLGGNRDRIEKIMQLLITEKK